MRSPNDLPDVPRSVTAQRYAGLGSMGFETMLASVQTESKVFLTVVHRLLTVSGVSQSQVNITLAASTLSSFVRPVTTTRPRFSPRAALKEAVDFCAVMMVSYAFCRFPARWYPTPALFAYRSFNDPLAAAACVSN